MLAKHGPHLMAAWVYGSVARGEDTAQSDVDVALLVSDQAAAERVRDDLADLGAAQQLEISVVALTPSELAALPPDDQWWTGVIEDGKVLKGVAPQVAKRHADKTPA